MSLEFYALVWFINNYYLFSEDKRPMFFFAFQLLLELTLTVSTIFKMVNYISAKLIRILRIYFMWLTFFEDSLGINWADFSSKTKSTNERLKLLQSVFL